jgi:hypothetical protein
VLLKICLIFDITFSYFLFFIKGFRLFLLNFLFFEEFLSNSNSSFTDLDLDKGNDNLKINIIK